VVERLKDAINKARETRERAVEQPPPPPVDRPQIAKPENELRDAMLAAVTRGPSAPQARQRTPVAEAWQALEEIQLNPTKLDKNRIISHKKSNPAHLSFDMLRTRILNMLRKHGWSRLAITSPTKGCGKSTVAVNLALSLGHQNDMRSMLFDVDMRAPSLAKYMDVRERLAMADFLQGKVEPETFLRRAGTNLAIGFNSEAIVGSAELFHHERTQQVLASTIARYQPNVVVYDLPPMLVSDDVMAFLPHVDCVLMVAAAGKTKPKELREAERLLADQTNFLGVMLNKSKEKTSQGYYYRN
jgi:Mrp family chromosome partitioning ATPase